MFEIPMADANSKCVAKHELGDESYENGSNLIDESTRSSRKQDKR